MKFLKIFVQLLLGCIFWILAAYWTVFLLYTITNLATGGPSAVIGWYAHTSDIQFHWSWRRFLFSQAEILAFTLAVYFLRRRVRRWTDAAGGTL